MIKIKESDIQKACMDYLNIKRIFAWRNNSGSFKTERGGFYRMGTPGSPDIIAVIKGRFIGIECKTIKGKQNDNQKEFEKKLVKSGGLYMIVRSAEELQELLTQL